MSAPTFRFPLRLSLKIMLKQEGGGCNEYFLLLSINDIIPNIYLLIKKHDPCYDFVCLSLC